MTFGVAFGPGTGAVGRSTPSGVVAAPIEGRVAPPAVGAAPAKTPPDVLPGVVGVVDGKMVWFGPNVSGCKRVACTVVPICNGGGTTDVGVALPKEDGI